LLKDGWLRIKEDRMTILTSATGRTASGAVADATPDGSAGTLVKTAERSGPANFKRFAKDGGKRALRRLFEAGQRLGVDVLPRHFYSQVPDIRELRADDSWKQPRSMAGVKGIELTTQFDFVETCCAPDVVDRLRQDDIHRRACAMNGQSGFGVPDAEFLYGFIRTIQPRKIVQVGCGVSTAVMLMAATDASIDLEVVCVEPYPTDFLEQAAREGRIRLVTARAQDVPLEILTELGEEGFLFVDSTHTVKPGSEVNRLMLEVLPRLKEGSWVHFHDIYFPYDYQRGVIDDELFFSNESVLLHALLINNRALELRAALSMLHYSGPDRLQRSLPRYRPAPNDRGLRAGDGHFPASAYLQVYGR
jgi:predicted O-methyltransferase YrrM